MSQDTFQFQAQHAIQWGLHAAIIFEFLCQQNNQTLSGSPTQWQSVFPFLQPSEIEQALNHLVAIGMISHQKTPSGHSQITCLSQVTEPGFDEPPPPAPNPELLTAHVTYIHSSHGAERYSDEPLYGRDAVSEAPPSGQRALMTLDWEPSVDCLVMLQQRGISEEFALAQRGNFVLYYRDSGQRNLSWDTKFLNWVSRCWQYHLNDQKQAHGLSTGQSMATTRGNRDSVRAKLRDITDTNW